MRHFDIEKATSHRTICLLGFVTLCILLFSQCQSKQKPDLASYYFPVEKLTDGLIYKYEFTDQLAPEYWYLKSFTSGDSVILTIAVYDAAQRQTQVSRERRFPSGWVQRDLFLYEYDSMKAKRMEVDIINDDLYPFNVKDSMDVTVYAAAWESIKDGSEVKNRLFRNRRWLRRDTIDVLGVPTPVQLFKVNDWIEDEREGTLKIEVESWEYYGLGWGLVKKDQYIDGSLFRSYELEDTMNMNRFEAIYRESWEDE